MFFSSTFAPATMRRRSDDDDDATTTTTTRGGGDARDGDEDPMIRPTAADDETPTTSSTAEDAADDAEPPRCYFIVHNIAKKHNVGTIARCATAFGVRAIVLVGAKAYNTFGCKGASNHVDFLHFPSLHAAREGLKAPPHRVKKIMGVEIMDDAVAIDDRPFEGSTAFIMGNEGDGLTAAQKAICDGFVYIRQVRARGEAADALVVRHRHALSFSLSLSLSLHSGHTICHVDAR
jgi:tRNA(Leu) C34 or U34 (ribose-2'-O)-methylase TrmL